MKKRVVVFGIFDGVHEGHRSLFRQAREYGDELAVIVGRDSSSLKLKGKRPRHSEEKRRELVLKEQGVGLAALGDREHSSYKVLEELNPDVICLGYDQNALEQDLRTWLFQREWNISLIRLKPHQQDRCHNSLYL